MPAKILVWNIQNFTLKKIDWTVGETVYDDFSPNRFGFKFGAQYNTLRNDYIISNVQLADPDIFVVIEVVSGRGVKGSLVTGRGGPGVTTLLARLRHLNRNWCLVPPLKLTDEIQVGEIEQDDDDEVLYEILSEGGYTEGIGVFFRSDRFDFIGPYVWPNQPDNTNAGKTAVPANGATPAPYPDEWQACLPNGNHFAGQFEFLVNGREKLFPAQGSRRPFFTKFREIGSQRIISIASVHFPPSHNSAGAALDTLVEYLDQTYQIANNEVLLIAGDYNINPFADNTAALNSAFGGSRFHLFLKDNNVVTSTMNYSNRYATPKKYVKNKVVLDNIAVKLGSQGASTGAQIQVLNRVENHSILFTPLATILGLPNTDQQNFIFRKPLNFQKIGPNPGTSDHLALLLQI